MKRLPTKILARITRYDRSVGFAPPASPREAEKLGVKWDIVTEGRKAFFQHCVKNVGCARQDVPSELPEHTLPFARFMKQMADKKLTPRDVAKAYLITTMSIQRSAMSAEKLRQRWTEENPFTAGSVRPEDAFATMLRTSVGQRYLDAIDRGGFDQAAANKMASWFAGYGLTGQADNSLRAAGELGKQAPEIDRLRSAPWQRWVKFVQKNVWGVSAAKAGFFASLLGRGDLPTIDARQLEFWITAKNVDPVEVDEKLLAEIRRRLRAIKMKVPAEYEPFRDHLTHHALWDAVGKTKTTHAELIEAMQLAGVG